jgi:organic hydroperoxide reductase OsmC/OhrA
MSDPNAKTHHFESHLVWIGAEQGGTTSYEAYSRRFRVDIAGKPPIVGSAAPPFLGESDLHNPEDLLVAALSACHFLSYAALCARSGIRVLAYEDHATGRMGQVDRVTRFTEVVLHPSVVVAPGSDVDKAMMLHARAHSICFIANSVNFDVKNEPTIVVEGGQESGRRSSD